MNKYEIIRDIFLTLIIIELGIILGLVLIGTTL